VFREALNYPTDGEHGSASLVLGGVLTLVLAVAEVVAVGATSELLSVVAEPEDITAAGETLWVAGAALATVLVVRVLLRGQYVAVLGAVAGVEDPVAPRFRGWSRVTDGLAAGLILLVYLLPAGLLLGGGLAAARTGLPGTAGLAVETVGGLATLLGILALVGAAYLLPAAATLYATDGRLRSAVALRRVAGGAFSEDYAVGWMVAALLLLFVWPIVYLLQALLVGGFLRFYLNTAVRYLHGRGMGDGLGLDRGPPSPATGPEGTLQSAVGPAEPSDWRAVDSPDVPGEGSRREIPGSDADADGDTDEATVSDGQRGDGPGTDGLGAAADDPMGEEFR
jgi:hypothetical protein